MLNTIDYVKGYNTMDQVKAGSKQHSCLSIDIQVETRKNSSLLPVMDEDSPLSWLPPMTQVNFGLFWQLDFEMLGRSPGLDKHRMSSSESRSSAEWFAGNEHLFSVDTCLIEQVSKEPRVITMQ